MKGTHLSIGFWLLTVALFTPAFAYAQESFTSLTNLPGLTDTLSTNTLPAFLNQLYKLCIGAAAVIAVLQIMRAGTKYFFYTGSVSQNQEAKKLIMNSLLGLLLVLSPAIVFGIINPDILDLRLNFSELEPEPLVPMDTAGRDNRCEIFTPGEKIDRTRQCSALGTGYVNVSNTCCAGYGAADAGKMCCARPKGDPAQAAREYMWKIRIQRPDKPEPDVQTSAAFTDQAACTENYNQTTGVILGLGMGTSIASECDCSKPRSEFAACKN